MSGHSYLPGVPDTRYFQLCREPFEAGGVVRDFLSILFMNATTNFIYLSCVVLEQQRKESNPFLRLTPFASGSSARYRYSRTSTGILSSVPHRLSNPGEKRRGKERTAYSTS